MNLLNLKQRVERTALLIWHSRGAYLRARSVVPPFQLRVGSATKVVEAPNDEGARSCFFEIYIGDVYGIRALARHFTPKVVVDIGANLGIFSSWCRLLFPNAAIYAYEPNPTPYHWVAKNSGPFSFHASRVAVTATGGVVQFDCGVHSTLGRISASGSLEVQAIATRAVAEGQQIDLLKIDCEGGEWEIFADGELLRRTRYMVMEYHIIDDQKQLPELIARIESAGHCVTYHRAIGTGLGLLRSRQNFSG